MCTVHIITYNGGYLVRRPLWPIKRAPFESNMCTFNVASQLIRTTRGLLYISCASDNDSLTDFSLFPPNNIVSVFFCRSCCFRTNPIHDVRVHTIQRTYFFFGIGIARHCWALNDPFFAQIFGSKNVPTRFPSVILFVCKRLIKHVQHFLPGRLLIWSTKNYMLYSQVQRVVGW